MPSQNAPAAKDMAALAPPIGRQGLRPPRGVRHATPRGVAIAALVAVDAGERANQALARLLARSGLAERDRAFATEVVYGTVRMRRACDWLVGQFARGDLEPVVRAAARAGTYQLVFMRVPAYAAVSATVAECPRRARPLLNALLRKVADLAGAGPVPWPDLGTELSYPDWLLERLSQDLGSERALGALVKMNEAARVSARPDGYVQDPASQAVWQHLASLLGSPADGQVPARRVLDVCSAPGGKATGLARSCRLVVAGDLSAPRAAQVRDNVRRLGLANVAVVLADGARPPWRPGSFDLVLVDAPCSGLGVLRRRPDARWRARPEDIARLASLQHRLVVAGAELVARGGLLAYSVCTLTREETLGLDERLASDLGPGWVAAEPPGPPWEPLGRGALLLPQAAGTDGMYLLVLRRR